MNSDKFYCRICFTSSENFLRPIRNQTRECFYALTSVELLNSDTYSNLICSKCDKKIQDTKKYCDELKSNELQLMGKLDEIVIEEAEEELQITSESQIETQNDLSETLEISNPLEDVQKSENEIILDIKEEEEEICEVGMNFVDPNELQESSESPEEIPRTSEIIIKLVEVKNPRKQNLKPREIQPEKASTFRICQEPQHDPEPPKIQYSQPYYNNPLLDAEIERLPIDSDGRANCTQCSVRILKLYYRQHVERLHLNAKNFTCDLCGKEFCLLTSLEYHMSVHANLKRVECRLKCGEYFPNHSSMRTHLYQDHPQVDVFVCEICEQKFKARHSLKDHILVVHEGHRWKCPYPNCNLEYTKERSLNDHIEDKHEFKMEQCDECGKMLRAGRQMYSHKKLHKEKNFSCKTCGKKFRFNADLKKHEDVHLGIKKFPCKYCDKAFFKKEAVKKHLLESHLGQKFTCDIPDCSSTFTNKCTYKDHIKTVHKNLSPDEMEKWLQIAKKATPSFEADIEDFAELRKKRGRPKEELKN